MERRNRTDSNEMGKKLLLIGGGGHCRSVLDSILTLKIYDAIGIVDYSDEPVNGISVVGKDEDLPHLKESGWTDAFITVGSVGNTDLRRRLYKIVKDEGFIIPSVIDPSAIIAKDAVINEGCFIGKGAIVNAGSKIGKTAIINTGAIIEHDCFVGDFAHISPGTVLCGQVVVGNDSHIGAGSVVRQQIEIGENALVGAGSVVVQNIPACVKAYGNPCKVVE